MKHYPRILEQIYHRPWYITAEGHKVIQKLIESKLDPEMDTPEIQLSIQNSRSDSKVDSLGIGHVYLTGPSGWKIGEMEKACGATCLCQLQKEFIALMEQGVEGIMFHVDSPGGTVTGTKETADLITSITKSNVTIYTFTDTVMASAAYFMGCSGDRIFSSMTATVGSIGTLLPLVDETKAWELQGKLFTPITNQAAIFKSAGHGPGITDEQRDQLQDQIEKMNSLFASHVIQQRVKDGQLSDALDMAMRGQTFMGVDAQVAGLVDEISTEAECYQALCKEIGIDFIFSSPFQGPTFTT